MTEPTNGLLTLLIRCCDCNRTAVITLPVDREDLARQLAGQGWCLSLVKWQHAERDQPESLVEPLCPVCDEARMRCPP